MSQVSPELRAVAEAAYGAVNSGDFDAFVALTTEDVEFTSLVAEAEGTTFHGHDGVRAWWETVRGAFEEVRWELLDVRGWPSGGVTHIRMAGTLSGVPVEARPRARPRAPQRLEGLSLTAPSERTRLSDIPASGERAGHRHNRPLRHEQA